MSELLQLRLSSAQTLVAALPPEAMADGYAFAGPDLEVVANRAWTVSVQAAAAVWDGSSGGRPDKPAEDLEWRLGGAGPYTPLTTSAVPVGSGGPTEGLIGSLNWNTEWSVLDTEGDYSIDVLFTIVGS